MSKAGNTFGYVCVGVCVRNVPVFLSIVEH